jgi:hypothetical protein
VELEDLVEEEKDLICRCRISIDLGEGVFSPGWSG